MRNLEEFSDEKVEEIKELLGRFPGIRFLYSKLDMMIVCIAFTVDDFSSSTHLRSPNWKMVHVRKVE